MKPIDTASVTLWALSGVIFVFAAMYRPSGEASSIKVSYSNGTSTPLDALLPAGEVGLITVVPDNKVDDVLPVGYDMNSNTPPVDYDMASGDDGNDESEVSKESMAAAPKPPSRSSQKKSSARPPKKSAPKPAPADLPCVDLNTADESALVTLKGIGPATAAKIIEYRAEHGNFAHNEDILKVKGIGPAKFAAVADRLCR